MKRSDFFGRKKSPGRRPLPPEEKKQKLYFFLRAPEAEKLRAYAEQLERERLARLRPPGE